MTRNRDAIITGPRIRVIFIGIIWTKQAKGHVPVQGMALLSHTLWLVFKRGNGGLIPFHDINGYIYDWIANQHGLLDLPGTETISGASTSTYHLQHMLPVDNSFPRARIRVGIFGSVRFHGNYWRGRKVAPCGTYCRMLSKVYVKFRQRRR